MTYHPIAKWLHWLVAALVLVQFATGWSWGWFERGSDPRFYLFRTHLTSGYIILALAVLRTGWRLWSPPPPLPAGTPRLAAIAARITHGALYAAILIQPGLGILASTAFGKSLGRWPGNIHVTLAYVIAAIVALHVMAALWHHLVLRDGLIRRMLPQKA